MHRILPLAWALLASGSLAAQTAASLQFEVASVKPSAPGAQDQVSVGMHIDGARINCNFLSLRNYVRLAYEVKDYQIAGPEWISSERYDIAATLPSGATQKDVPEMLKALLADRFHLKLHRETKDFPVYALVDAKGGLKIKESPLDPEMEASSAKSAVNVTGGGSRDGVAVSLGHGASYTFKDNKLEAKKITLTQFADTLGRFMDKPVVDMTGAAGTWDIVLNVTDEDYEAMLIRAAVNSGVTLPLSVLQRVQSASGDSMASAMQAAGLKLEPRKAPLEVIVVDSADKMPSSN